MPRGLGGGSGYSGFQFTGMIQTMNNLFIILSQGAAATYFKSLNDAFVRTKKGKQGSHKVTCRRQGRMRDVSF